MVTTTSYGSWSHNIEATSPSIGEYVLNVVGGEPEGLDVPAILHDYVTAINAALPDHVALTGNEFIGPYFETDQHFGGYPLDEDGRLDIKAIVESVDLNAIIERHDKED